MEPPAAASQLGGCRYWAGKTDPAVADGEVGLAAVPGAASGSVGSGPWDGVRSGAEGVGFLDPVGRTMDGRMCTLGLPRRCGGQQDISGGKFRGPELGQG